jgi:hypothetical protein
MQTHHDLLWRVNAMGSIALLTVLSLRLTEYGQKKTGEITLSMCSTLLLTEYITHTQQQLSCAVSCHCRAQA